MLPMRPSSTPTEKLFVSAIVVLDAAEGRAWGFVSVNDPKAPLPAQIYPRQ